MDFFRDIGSTLENTFTDLGNSIEDIATKTAKQVAAQVEETARRAAITAEKQIRTEANLAINGIVNATEEPFTDIANDIIKVGDGSLRRAAAEMYRLEREAAAAAASAENTLSSAATDIKNSAEFKAFDNFGNSVGNFVLKTSQDAGNTLSGIKDVINESNLKDFGNTLLGGLEMVGNEVMGGLSTMTPIMGGKAKTSKSSIGTDNSIYVYALIAGIGGFFIYRQYNK